MPAPGQPENASFPGEFIPAASGKKCDKVAGGWGIPMTDYEYIWYGNMNQSTYPVDACLPYHHLKAKIDSLQVNTDIRGSGGAGALSITSSAVTFSKDVSILGTLNVTGAISGTTITALTTSINSKKSFDIPHPTKENHRLRYICLEGPQAEVYLRGKLINQSVIELPDYWRELVDAETIGVTLTSVGSYQELYVEKIELGTHITIKNSAGGAINCTYFVYGERKDTSRNIPEYEGTSPKDYPGDNREYSINSGNKNWT